MPGIYIHIPFCKQKCTYCDFHFSTTFESYRTQMVEKMCEEITLRSDYLEAKQLGSIYFGGGTPSLLNSGELEMIFAALRKNFDFDNKAEITLEANPDDVTLEKIEVWKSMGINRFSIGLQSFKAQDLEWMNRAHRVEDGFSAVNLLQAQGICNISVDLIYGLPDLSDEEWAQHLQHVLNLKVPHVSSYCLTVEKKTALYKMVRNKTLVTANEEAQERQFLMMSTFLEENGFQHYEISNFAKRGKEAVHNSNYWKSEHYLGIGPSAHSFNGISRRWNVANNSFYMKHLGKNDNWYEEEILSQKDQWNEYILTGLRTSWGISIKHLETFSFFNTNTMLEIEKMIDNNLAQLDSDQVLLTKKGMLQADALAANLFV
jgi:oxygen-independent coproporphyrinogen-3 oxidase